jgi:hypothetical protein
MAMGYSIATRMIFLDYEPRLLIIARRRYLFLLAAKKYDGFVVFSLNGQLLFFF